MALSQIHTPATFTQICCFVIIPHWDDMHICDEACFLFFLLSWYSENTITTCVHTQKWYWWRMWWKWLVQMHAPSLEAVNLITIVSPSSSSSSICSHNPFFSPSCDPQWGAWTHLHTKRLERWTRNRRSASFIFQRRLSGEQACPHLLSSPPALTMKRSPFVKRMLVRWAEWPRKRLCLAWNGHLSQSTNELVPCY